MTDQAYGHLTPGDSNSEMSGISAIVEKMIAEMSTMKLVQVQAVHGGGTAGSGTVDVLPLVQQIDGNGYGTPHGTVYGLPWSRLQGGDSAVICDPAAGDVGYVVAADRDTSTVRATGAQALPGSRRQYDVADGVYAGACLSVGPAQYLIFTASGVRLVDRSGNSVSMGPSGVNISDVNANQIVMAAGFVNIITPVLKVNGVPVTVP